MIFVVSNGTDQKRSSILVRDNGDIERTIINEDGKEIKIIIENENTQSDSAEQ